MSGAFDHANIRDRIDRSQTNRLLAALAEESRAEERDEIAQTLIQLEDPAAFAPLTEILASPQYGLEARRKASWVLMSTGYGPDFSSTRSAEWWASDDPLLKRHALLASASTDEDRVKSVLRDPASPYLRDALKGCTFGAETRAFVELILPAFQHPDPEIRALASFVFLWSEAIVAEVPLLAATHDAEESVVDDACNTLRYFPSHAVVRRLAESSAAASPVLAGFARQALDDLRWRFLGDLRHQPTRAALRRWMDPVWDLLAFTDEEIQELDETSSLPEVQPTPREQITLKELHTLLQDEDGCWAPRYPRLRHLDWDAFATRERAELELSLVQHPDGQVREIGARALASWGAREGLLRLAIDPVQLVRKSAVYYLGTLAPDATLAHFLCEMILRNTSCPAYEAMSSFFVHAPRGQSVPFLVDLILDDKNEESLRCYSIYELQKAAELSALERVLALVTKPPSVNWSIHVALIESAEKLHLKLPDLSCWRDVDNLDLQAALALADL